MVKTLLFSLSLLLLSAISVAQYFSGKKPVSGSGIARLNLQLKKSKGKAKVELLLKIGSGYIYRAGQLESDLDSASYYIQQASSLSAALKYTKGYQESILLRAALTTEQKGIDETKKLIPLLNDTSKIKLMVYIIDHYMNRLGADPLKPLQKSLDSSDTYIRRTVRTMIAKKQYKFSAEIFARMVILADSYKGARQPKMANERYQYVLDHKKIVPEFVLTKAYIGSGKAPEFTSTSIRDTSGINTLIKMSDHYWREGGANKGVNVDKPLLDTSLLYAEQALKLSLLIKNQKLAEQAITRMQYVAMFHKIGNNFPLAISQFEHIIRQSKLVPGFSLTPIYIETGFAHKSSGNFDKALNYFLKAEKALKSSEIYELHTPIYTGIGDIYRVSGKYEQSNAYFNAIIKGHKERRNAGSVWVYLEYVITNYVYAHQNQQALAYFQRAKDQYPVTSNLDHLYYNLALGRYHNTVKEYALAESYYLKAERYSALANRNPGNIYYALGEIYYNRHDYEKASIYYKKTQAQSPALNTQALAALHFSLYKIDSVQGNFKSALANLLKSKQVNDSMFTMEKEKQKQRYEIEYETQKKDAILQLNAKDIITLNQKTELLSQEAKLQQIKLNQSQLVAEKKETDLKLQEKNMDALAQTAKLQESKLQRATLVRNITIVIIVLFIIIVVLLYTQSKQKQRSSQIILQNNKQLAGLVQEKDWLLKEVHHRVKNNLQTVISLLESQAAYLKDDALKAMEKCQHRIYVMSLIHQKLYQSDDVKTINMPLYISEFVGYLLDSFDVRHQIRFEQHVDEVELSIAQSVPLALILNEAVTNSIKYAFPNRSSGIIKIELQKIAGRIYMTISDNGVGFGDITKINMNKTLGLKLIKGLCMDLDAKIQFQSNNGTSITIYFSLNSPYEIHEADSAKVTFS